MVDEAIGQENAGQYLLHQSQDFLHRLIHGLVNVSERFEVHDRTK